MNRFLSKRVQFWLLLCLPLIAIYIYVAAHFNGFYWDTQYWVLWGWWGKEQGLVNMYDEPNNNYFPFLHYVFTGFAYLFSSKEALAENIYFLRYFTFLFDIGGVFIVYRWLNRVYSFWFLFFFALLNVAFCYNSLIWGQEDAILAFFVFASLYFLWNKKILVASVLMALALSLKLQAIIFVPIFGLLLLMVIPRKDWLPQISLSLAYFVSTFLVVCLPFLTSAHRVQALYKVFTGLVDFFPKITVSSFIFWSIIFNKESDAMPDSMLVLGIISYKRIGVLLFFTASFFALLPMLRIILDKIKGKATFQLPLDKFLLSCALVALSFFMFNTQMHERYNHPVFLFLMGYAFFKKDFFPFILFSIAHFLNMENLLREFDFENYHTLIYKPYFVGSLFAIVEVYLFFRLFQKNGLDN